MTRKVPIITSKPFELFLDLDGVFADFNKRVFKLSGSWPHELGKGLWKVVMADKEFFASLEMMPNAEHLWEYAKQYNPVFLTGAPPGERSRNQKKEWVAKQFGTEHTTIVLPKRDKLLHSGWRKVLVDDTPANVQAWIEKGGAGILHKDPWETIDQLEELRAQYSA
jgi:5'(3')-deoxyribonucleotidase